MSMISDRKKPVGFAASDDDTPFMATVKRLRRAMDEAPHVITDEIAVQRTPVHGYPRQEIPLPLTSKDRDATPGAIRAGDKE